MATVKCFFSLWEYNNVPDKWSKVNKTPQELYRTVLNESVKEVRWVPQTLYDGIEVHYVFESEQDATLFIEKLPEEFKYSRPTLVK